MKGILEFDLPEEQDEFDAANKAQHYRNSLIELDCWLRKLEKYEDKVVVEISKVRELINEALNCG